METTTNKRDLDLSRENRGKINEGESGVRWRGNFPPHPPRPYHLWQSMGQIEGTQYKDSDQTVICLGKCVLFMGTTSLSPLRLYPQCPASAQSDICRHGKCVCI